MSDLLSRMKIDPNCIGTGLIALNCRPVFFYENGRKISDEIKAFKYETLCPGLNYDKLWVTVDISAKRLDVSEDNPLEVEYDELELIPVWTPSGYIVKATAKGIHTVES